MDKAVVLEDDVSETANGDVLLRRKKTLRPNSKWRVAQRMIGLMDSNRASNEKQDFADIVKMFQRLNAQKIFDNLDAKNELRDIQNDLHTVRASEGFGGLEAASAKVAETKYDSVELQRGFSQELDSYQQASKGECAMTLH